MSIELSRRYLALEVSQMKLKYIFEMIGLILNNEIWER